MRTPVKRYGGKIKLADTIIGNFPPHRSYVEIFGGSLAILFRKAPSRVEIVNDIDDDVYNFWFVVRNHAKELVQRLNLTPYSRYEMSICNKLAKQEKEPIERARLFFVRSMMSMNGYMGHGWSRHLDDPRSMSFYRAANSITQIIERLRQVQLEKRDFRKLIPECDNPDTLMYLDPPYQHDARRCSTMVYDQEMSQEDHCELLDLINKSKAMIVLSGYRSELYDRELSRWTRMDIERPIFSRFHHGGKQTEIAVESLWLNPAAVAAHSPQYIN